MSFRYPDTGMGADRPELRFYVESRAATALAARRLGEVDGMKPRLQLRARLTRTAATTSVPAWSGWSGKRAAMAAGAAKRGALICSFLALALSAGGAPAADTAPDVDASCGAECLARMLMERIPAGETVALIPFGPPRTGIPEGVAKELQDTIQRALASASAGRHDFISRDLFDEKWRGWQGADFEAFLARQHIDVAVLCEDRAPRGAEVRLSCTARAAGEERARAIVEDRLAAVRLREAGEAAALDGAWLPSDLLADPGPRRHCAAGRAVESAGFGAAAAPRAALNLVRARLVAGALGHAAPLAFEDLAPPACHDSTEPTPVAAPANAFFAALAGPGLERAAIAVLPYRVAE